MPATRTHAERRTEGRGAQARASRSHARAPDATERLQRQLGNRLFRAEAAAPRILQRCACGGTCAHCRGEHEVQARLVVGAPDDAYEREAERVSAQVVSAPEAAAAAAPSAPGGGGGGAAPAIRRAPSAVLRRAVEEDMEERTPSVLHTAPEPGRTPAVTPDLHAYVRRLPAGGAPMPPASRSFFEPRLGADFGAVRVHTDAAAAGAARSIGARAFTLGSDIVFGAGEYAPQAAEGRRLLAHELVHVVQQGGGSGAGAAGPRVSRLQRAGVVQRAISPELDRIEELLSYGILDWKIFDSEAVAALDLLAALPRFQQAVFFSNKTYAGRLRSNLPDNRVQEFDDLRADAGPQPALDTVERIRDLLSYGIVDWRISDAEAVEALDLLVGLPAAEQAVALGSIDYGRLMDNLPDGRRQELIDLLARGLGTGGTRETDEKAHPTGKVLYGVSFKSDHGLMKDNTSDWSSGGTVFPEPEWTHPGRRVVSHPISHTRNTSIEAEVDLNLLPLSLPPGPLHVTGTSDVDFLRFDGTGTARGGIHQKLRLTSAGKLPDAITRIAGKHIDWSMEWQGSTHALGRTGPHTIFVTSARPRSPDEVTQKRMDKSVELAGSVGELDPHKLVRGIMLNWGNYNLDVQYTNAWEMADDIATGAQCIDIVRFVDGIIRQVGVEGTAVAVVVSALPDAPYVPVEEVWGGRSPGLWKVDSRIVSGERAVLGLLDANGCPNNYEAALRFDHGGSRIYYPGGVDLTTDVYTTPKDVLYVFQCLAWLAAAGHKRTRMVKKVAEYQMDMFNEGDVITCH